MKMHEYNPEAARAALLIHPMLSSAEGIELCVLFHIKVNAGIAVGVLRADEVKALGRQPLPHNLVGGLAVEVDPAQPGLVHSD